MRSLDDDARESRVDPPRLVYSHDWAAIGQNSFTFPVSRGPIALERLSVDGDGLVVYALKHPFRDGTTHVLFEPLDFVARLAPLDCRAGIVPDNPCLLRSTSSIPGLVRRVFDIDLRYCPRCPGPMRVIAAVTEPALITRILQHLDRRDGSADGARAPPALHLH